MVDRRACSRLAHACASRACPLLQAVAGLCVMQIEPVLLQIRDYASTCLLPGRSWNQSLRHAADDSFMDRATSRAAAARHAHGPQSSGPFPQGSRSTHPAAAHHQLQASTAAALLLAVPAGLAWDTPSGSGLLAAAANQLLSLPQRAEWREAAGRQQQRRRR